MLKTYVNTFRDFNHDLRVLLISAALVGFTFFGVFSALFNIFLLRLGFDTQSIGQVNGAGWLAYALLCVPAGVLARRIGIRQVLVIGLGLMSAGFALSALPGLIVPAMQKTWVIISTVMSKVGFAFYFPNLASALLRYCRPEERSHVFSAEWALFALGGFAGSYASGQAPGFFATFLNDSIQNPTSYQYVLLAGALLLTLALKPLSRLGTAHENARVVSIPRTSRTPYLLFILMASIYFLWMVGENGVGVFFNVFLDTKLDVSVSNIGSLMAAAQLITIPLILLMPLITTRIGTRNMIFYFLLIVSACFILIASASNFIPAGIFYLVLCTAASIARPAYLLFCQTRVVVEWRPVMSGAVSTMSGLGSAFTSALGGSLISSIGFSPFFLLCAVILAFSAGVFAMSFIFPGWIARSDCIRND